MENQLKLHQSEYPMNVWQLSAACDRVKFQTIKQLAARRAGGDTQTKIVTLRFRWFIKHLKNDFRICTFVVIIWAVCSVLCMHGKLGKLKILRVQKVLCKSWHEMCSPAAWPQIRSKILIYATDSTDTTDRFYHNLKLNNHNICKRWERYMLSLAWPYWALCAQTD